MTHHDHAAWTAAAHARPGIAVYPQMLRQPNPPAVRPAQRPAAPVAEVGEILRAHLPAIGEALTAALTQPRRRWWHRLTRR